MQQSKLDHYLRSRLFPYQHCELPEAPANWPDVVHVTTIASLSFVDRLRVLASGQLRVDTRTVTENVVGDSRTSSVAFPIWKWKG